MEKQLRKYLNQYHQALLPLVMIVSGIVLIFVLIIPQFSQISELRTDIETQSETNKRLLSSQSTLSAISETQLEEEYTLALKALPDRKSVAQIFDALTTAASKSNVSIGSFSVQLGSIYDSENNSKEKQGVTGIPFVNLVVRATGSSTSDLRNFASVLYKAVPVVEVNSIGISDTEGSYDVNFYFKPINIKGFQSQDEVAPLTPQQRSLLDELKTWES